MKYAHYFKNTLIISTGPQPVGKTYSVAGKREARKLASELNAQPWSF